VFVRAPPAAGRPWRAVPGAKEAAELMLSAGGSASPYASNGIERCVRGIYAACQHVTLAPPNYEMAGQALLGADMCATLLLAMDNRRGSNFVNSAQRYCTP